MPGAPDLRTRTSRTHRTPEGQMQACRLFMLGLLMAAPAGGLCGPVEPIVARVPVENWEQARHRVDRERIWSRWVDERRIKVDDWMIRRQDHVEWISGWLHDYVDASGNMLPWTPDNRPADDATAHARRLTEGWNHVFRNQHVDRMLDAAHLYRLTGKSLYAHWAASQLDFYASSYLLWPEQRRQGISRLMGQSLDEAVLLIRLAETARLLGPEVEPATRRRWRDGLFLPAAANLIRSLNGLSNITLWQLSALIVIGTALEDPAMVLKATDNLLDLMQRGLTSEALWHEGSLSYNRYAVRALLPGLEALMRSGASHAAAAKIAQSVKDMIVTPMQMRFEDRSLPTPGDSTERLFVPDLEMLRLTRRLFTLPYADLGKTISSAPAWPDLVDPAPLSGSLSQMPDVISRVFGGAAMGQLRNPFWQIFMHWGQTAPLHAQKEALNVELQAGSAPVSRDPGTVLYGSEWHKQYYTQAAAHNVALADDTGQIGWHPGQLVEFSETPPRLVARQPQYNAQVSVTRTLRLDAEKLEDTLVIEPRADAKGPAATVGGTWHFDCRIADLQGTKGPSADLFPAVNGFQYWSGVHAGQATDRIDFTLDCDGQRVLATLALAGEFTIFKGMAPGPRQKPRTALYIRQNGSRAVLQTVFRLEPRAN